MTKTKGKNSMDHRALEMNDTKETTIAVENNHLNQDESHIKINSPPAVDQTRMIIPSPILEVKKTLKERKTTGSLLNIE
jgi:hypothetical protein